MEQCTVETGLLKKKPCGEKAVTKCANCEQPLCSKHAVPQMSAGHKTFLCPECAKAWKQSEKTVGTLPPTPAAAPAARKPAEAVQRKVEPPPVEKSGPLEFTPSEKKPAEDSGPLEFTLEPTDPKDKK